MISRNMPCLSALIGAAAALGVAAAELPEPGPEVGGLRLRLRVGPEGEGHDVRLDLLNVSGKRIALKLHWLGPGRSNGEAAVTQEVFRNVLLANVGVESDPALAPYVGQVGIGSGVSWLTYGHKLEPEQAIDLRWKTAGRRFKPGGPLMNHNPEFLEDRLYSVRVSLKINADGRSVLLRSNEQLVSFGGSRKMPRSRYGSLTWVNGSRPWNGSSGIIIRSVGGTASTGVKAAGVPRRSAEFIPLQRPMFDVT